MYLLVVKLLEYVHIDSEYVLYLNSHSNRLSLMDFWILLRPVLLFLHTVKKQIFILQILNYLINIKII